MCKCPLHNHSKPEAKRWTRRRLLGAMSATPLLPLMAAAQDKRVNLGANGIVDVHAHFQPPSIRALNLPGPMNAWSLQQQLDDMDQAGVSRAMLSITTPGVPMTGTVAQKIARESNEYAAMLSRDEGERFGFFTAVPMDNIDTALEEIAYAFDSLGAHGVGLFTSYDNKWLGDSHFDPVFEELNRRGSVVYVHPTTAACCTRLIPEVADTLIEYGTDTTRAIASYVYRDAALRYPNVRMIWSHSGGTMPFLIERFDGADRQAEAQGHGKESFRDQIGRFYFDIAQASNPVATQALRSVVPMNKIVFGTDYPFRTSLDHVASLRAGSIFSPRELEALFHANVQAGLPELLQLIA